MAVYEISRPIKLLMNIIDSEDRCKSLKIDISINLEQFSFSINYKGTDWFLCDDIDKFTYILNTMYDTAVLKNIDENFVLEILKLSDAKYKFSLIIHKKSVIEENSKLEYSTFIDDDVFSTIKDIFNDFPKCW